jgi:hypothetical protein
MFTWTAANLSGTADACARLRTLAISFDSLVHSIIVQEELGLELVNWHVFFDDAKMRDVLDFVTIAYRHLAKQSYT